MAFALIVEMINIRMRSKISKPVRLYASYAKDKTDEHK
jgi:hypothetical protein